MKTSIVSISIAFLFLMFQTFIFAIEAGPAPRIITAEEWERKVKKDPNNAERHFELGYIYSELKEYDKTIKEYKIAIGLHPDNEHEIRCSLALVYKDIGKWNDAINELEEAIKLKEDFLPAHFNLGVCLASVGQYELAIKSYQKCLDKDANDIAALQHIAFAYNGLRQYDKSIEYMKRAIGIKEDVSDLHYNLALIYDTIGKKSNAVTEYRRAIKLDRQDHLNYNNLAALYYEEGIYRDAVNNFNKAISCAPLLASAHYGLGLTYKALGDVKNSVGCLEKAKKLYEEEMEYGVDNKVRLEEITVFLKELRPKYDVFLKEEKERINREKIQRQERFEFLEKEKERLKEELKKSPDDIQLHYKLAEILREMGKIEEAEKEYNRIIKLDPKNADAYIGLGLTLGKSLKSKFFISKDDLAKNELGPGYKSYQKAIELGSKSPIPYIKLGEIILYLDMEKAKGYFNKYMEIDNNNPKINFNLGEIEAVSGNKDKAKEHFERTIKYSGGNEYLNRISQEEIKKLDLGIFPEDVYDIPSLINLKD